VKRTRSTNNIGMLIRCAPSTASDLQLPANGHVSCHVLHGHSGDIQTGLVRKRRADRSSDTPGTPPPVGAERSCTVDWWTSTLRSNYMCSGQLALMAARPGAHPGAHRTRIAPEYLGPVVRVADLPGRPAHRSAGTNRLVVPSFKLSTFGSRTFPAAGHSVWNSLPTDITSAPSL